MKSDIVRHLQELQNTFLLYFPKGMFNCDWVRNQFSCSTAAFTGKTTKEFIKLSSNGNLKLQFTSHLSSKFWPSLQKEYPTLAREALKKLLPFATTYLCKTRFSRCPQKQNTGTDWMLKQIFTFNYQLIGQT